jgi:hypothetical protein
MPYPATQPATTRRPLAMLLALTVAVFTLPAPLTPAAGQLLLTIFGPGNCFGLAWTVLHLIETAPGALTAVYARNADNDWVKLLERRRSG